MKMTKRKTTHFLLKSITACARIKETISKEDKQKLYQGMLLTRATDNALKKLFLSGEMIYQGRGFQGKGFRSLGQEAIYGVALKLKHGASYINNGLYHGDVAAPLIRDLGVYLAMTDNNIASAINAQAGKEGKPCHGRDLHLGDWSCGLLTPAAPLAIATCTLVGIALSFKRKQEPRVAISFIGEGGSSLGEWHEAINFASVLGLPMVFCIQNNQTALSTPVSMQCRAQTFAHKGIGYGIKSMTVDGNDIEAIASAFKFAADEARCGQGPILIELITMRMCGHAHHDDMLYLGYDPSLGFDIELPKGGYVDEKLFKAWQANDPIKRYEKQLLKEEVLSDEAIKSLKEAAVNQVNEAVLHIKRRAWPVFAKRDEELVFKSPWIFTKRQQLPITEHSFSEDGISYLHGIAEGLRQILTQYENSLIIGEDVALPYGNAFMMFKGLDQFSNRFINTPISENAIVGACVGLALSGFLPIGEMQFNDFVACAMDQVINNAAKCYFRLGLNVPMVLRMPYGGLRRAGPFHSQDTSPWFYRTPGLKIMAPSTPIDAMLMLIKAVKDEDPVLFFEHIALYRDPKIKQSLSLINQANVDGAALIHQGTDITIISYGAYSHVAKNVAVLLEKNHHKSADVIDLRYLMPLDFDTLCASIKKTSRVLMVGEDSKTGSILESIASKIGEQLFSFLDAPVTVLGSRNTPVPYAPSLEDQYLLSPAQITDTALKLIEF